ncbi:MAG: NAD(P)/FAD-dependent oxidoreductase, partial [Lautropia sp.]|nr:NAD(P)/FAD-dependent oxidoreductase [Lautropia sp.]
MKNEFDVIVIGAGAAGLYCAGRLGQRGLRVLVLDHARRIGEKIRISGGGRCNFTNLQGDDPARYLSADPHFVRHALRAHPPARFIGLLREARIGFHEKHR